MTDPTSRIRNITRTARNDVDVRVFDRLASGNAIIDSDIEGLDNQI